jgi:hypothetical protein
MAKVRESLNTTLDGVNRWLGRRVIYYFMLWVLGHERRSSAWFMVSVFRGVARHISSSGAEATCPDLELGLLNMHCVFSERDPLIHVL